MQWRKLGLVVVKSHLSNGADSHASVPVPYIVNDEIVRIYFTALDPQGRGRPTFVDLFAENPKKVMNVSSKPLLEIGIPGAFDDNGVMPVSVICAAAGTLYMYYVGFEKCTKIRYRIFTGLAVSFDNGLTFEKYRRTPILDRTDAELFFRCGPFVMLDNGVFKLWYVAGSEWTTLNGKPIPVYDLRYQESMDGIRWSDRGTLSMAISGEDEHGFGRPWVIKRGPEDYQLFYSIRRRSFGAYRLGYAESADGINWVRKDEEMGLDVSPDGFDSHAIMYSAVISVKGKTYCFYNGNNFGQEGFGVAELVE